MHDHHRTQTQSAPETRHVRRGALRHRPLLRGGRQLRVNAGEQDLEALTEALRRRGAPRALEPFGAQPALDGVVRKPWGWEYWILRNHFYDVWKLRIAAGASTSFHCHPRKATALLCLAGSGTLESFAGPLELSAGDLVQIERAAFHSTRNHGESDLHLVEVELPRDKLDLVRLGDRYGRDACTYESELLAGPLPTTTPAGLDAPTQLRGESFTGDRRFAVHPGSEAGRDWTFAVSLSLRHAVRGAIEVVTRGPQAALTPDQPYLVI